MTVSRSILLFFTILLAAFPVAAQDFDQMREELQRKQDKARDEINQLKAQIQAYERQISETDRKFDVLEKQFEAAVREVALRQRLLQKLASQREDILSEIRITEENYNAYEKQLDVLTKRYRKSMSYLYKHGRAAELMLLFTSTSINQLLSRSYYLAKFGQERDRQAKAIEAGKSVLRKKADELAVARKKNDDILEETRAEQRRLEGRKQQQERTIKLMERDRKQLQSKLKDVSRQVNNLTKVLTELIREEERIREAEAEKARKLEAERMKRLEEARKIRDAKEREKAVAKYSEPAKEEKTLAAAVSIAELEVIEKTFISQRGKLPWPVEGGAVSARFGTKVHPVYKTRIDNPGIEIAVDPGSRVKAVHDGYVMSIQPITGFGDVVIVNHGRYKSVYGNLSEVNVTKNMPVRKGDEIGRSGTENSAKGPVVFFMIWEKGKNIDPETWISKR